MTFTIRLVGVAALTLTLGIAVAADAAPPTFSVLRPNLRIDASKPQGLAEISIQAKGERVGETPGALIVRDDESVAVAPKIVFYQVVDVPTLEATRRVWRVLATVSDAPATGTTQLRKIKVEWGEAKADLSYVFSNAAQPALSWKVTGLPSQWSASTLTCIPLRIAASGTRATGISLTTTLVERATKEPFAPRLFLSIDGTRADSRLLESAVNDANEAVSMCVDERAKPGTYEGSVNISAAEKPDGDPVSVTVYVTSTSARLTGIVLLLLGSAAAYVLRVRAPAGLARKQALLPAALLREQAQALRTRVAALFASAPTGVAAPKTEQALQALANELSEGALDSHHLLPPRIPVPFGPGPDAARYKQVLDEASASLARLELLATEGFAPALQNVATPNLATTISALDALPHALPPPTLPALSAAIQALLASSMRGLAAAMPGGRRDASSQMLIFQIEETSTVLWLASVVLSFVIGLFVLVFNNPAFGVPLDYLYCVLWAFGLPTAVQQLSGTSATTALGLTLPKSST